MAATPRMNSKRITSTTVRRAEVALVSIVLGSAIVMAIDVSAGVVPQNELLGETLLWSVFFLVPLALAGATLLAVVSDEVGLGSLVAGGVALVTIGAVILAVYALFAPSDGGVYVGHLLSFGSALALSVAALLRPALDRVSARVWLRPGLIDLS